VTRLTPRLRWRQAVASNAFPSAERVIKGTLLALVELMAATGELHEWRDDIAAATGLPVRTLNRHLERAVELGWLVREIPGGNGRRSLYRAVIPGASSAPEVAHNSGSSGPSTRTQLSEVVGHLVAHSIKKSANESERVAVDDQRGRRTSPAVARVSPPETSGKSGSNGNPWLATPSKRPSSVRTTAGEVA
jgi:hypothetical protein